MEQAEFDSLVAQPEELIKKIKSTSDKSPIDTYIKQYDPAKHDIMDPAKRPDKIVETDNGVTTVAVTRLAAPFQKKIVSLAASFLCGNPIGLSATPASDKEKDFLSILQRTWHDNKLNYDSKAIAKLMMSETEAAEIWYVEPVDEGYWAGTVNDTPSVQFRLRMKIVAYSLGDSLYPIYNAAGDMIAFGRGYSVIDGDKTVEHFDVYTANTLYSGLKGDAGWVFTLTPNTVGKIPVIYYRQPLPEWSDVQWLIDRFEKVISNHGDTNDYFVSPMVFVEGDIEGFAKKGETGKVLQGKNGAKASYLTWDQSPESLKLEYSNLRSLIHDMTDTPDISIEQLKGIGDFSGIALKMLFLGAHLKASDKEEIFGKSIQRRINFMKAALAVINVSMEDVANMQIEPVFEYYLPKNIEELITLLNTATGGRPTMSQATAVKQNPFVSDADAELKLIAEEGLNTEQNAL